jgi:hypothetical protein
MRMVKYYGKKERHFIIQFLNKIERSDLISKVPIATYSTKEWITSLISLLDLIAKNSQLKIWLEKTPMHLYFATLIEKIFPNTKFIHIIRDGEDVVASLYEASKNNPEYFDGEQSINRCILRWKIDIQIHKKHLGKSNHHFIRYKDLIYNTDDALGRLSEFLEIEYSDEMRSFTHKTKELKFPEEEWKPDQSEELKESNKFKKIFSIDEQTEIQSKLSSVDLSLFR